MRRGRLACVLVSAMALMTTTATTAHANDPVAAEALFHEARALLAKGRIDEACDLFMRSEQLDPGVGTLINVGDCFEHKKQYASAWGAYREAVNRALRQHDPNDKRLEIAREKAAQVEPRVARLTLTIDPSLGSASVTRNGTKVEPAALNTAIPVDPGPQVVVVTAPNRKPWQGKIELREGEAGALRVPRLEVLPGPVEPPTPSPKPPADEPGPTTQSKVAVGLEIGGGIVLATGLVFGALAISTWSSVQKTCPNARCANEADRSRLDGDQKRTSTFAAVSTVATLVGGAALATGVVLHLTAPARSLAITPTVGGFLATLTL
jgi:hypothetical protein